MIPAHAGPTIRTVATGVLVAVAVAASMLALTTVIVAGPWVDAGLAGIALVTATTTTTRILLERRGRARRAARDAGSVLPTLAGALVATWYVLARYGGPTSDLDVFVAPDHLARLVARLGEAGQITRAEVAPVDGTLPIALLAVGGTLLVLLLADALAGGLRRPAATGIPLLALWGPPLVLTGAVPWAVFVVTVAALLLLLTVEGPPGARRRPARERLAPPVRRAERARAAVTTLTAVVVALAAGVLGSASAALPGAAGGWYRAFTTTGDSIRLAEDLDVLSNLTERSSSVVLRYESAAETDVGPLRSYTATAFDGRRWLRGEDRDGQEFTPDEVLWPDDAPPAAGPTQDVMVTVDGLSDDKLPLSVDPRTVTAPEAWRYDPLRDEVVGSRTESGDTYSLGVRARDLSPGLLRGAGGAELDPAFTEVPDTPHADEIAQQARDVVGDAATPYDQAVALQRWLRDPSRFTYSTTLARGGTGDPVWDFLQQRTGYCVQFSTTMVVMARSLGLPTRLAVGYLPGDRTEDANATTDGSGDSPGTESENASEGRSTWQVTGQDSHSWPEIYFPGTGWVRFEPTPAQQTGAAPEYTIETTAAVVPDRGTDVRDPRTAAPEAPAETEEPASSAPVPGMVTADDDVPAWVWALTSALVVALATVVVHLLLRRRREAPDMDPERAWQEVLEALGSQGVRLAPPTTLRSAPDAIASQVADRTGTSLDPAVLDDLATLARAAEQSRYARVPDVPDSAQLAVLTRTVTTRLAHGPGRN